ncbi:hypothetical protein WMY93_032326 [Mugilogobius chulae]|uniref:Uncharacterized protein n=1 Tax=Mugilogobius chulae TaxID=88201 RepID=A0AAW0MRW6_9GOBI
MTFLVYPAPTVARTSAAVIQAVTKDGFDCIRCPGSVSDEGFCTCPVGSILVERDLNGNILEEAQCEVCNGNKPASTVPNINGDRCERCQASFVNTSCTCGSPGILSGGLCFPPGNLPTNANPSVNFAQLKINVHSAWFDRNLYSSAAACLVYSNLTACQALGNMCVMNMHSFSGVSTDACGLFNTIIRSRAALSSTHDISYWKANLPWLYYGEEPGLANRVLQTYPVPIGFSFRGKNEFTAINLLAAVYDVRGEFLKWVKIGPGNLQLCPDTTIRQAAAFSFGTSYQESCTLSVKDLLVSHPEPVFFDIFMDLGGDENKKLLPLPSLVSNQQYNGKFINQETMTNWYLSRRLFLVDTLSGREKSLSTNPKVIRVVKSLKIKFQLVPRTQEGQIFPPLIAVTYEDVPITDIETQQVTASFSVEYEMDQDESIRKMNAVLGLWAWSSDVFSPENRQLEKENWPPITTTNHNLQPQPSTNHQPQLSTTNTNLNHNHQPQPSTNHNHQPQSTTNHNQPPPTTINHQPQPSPNHNQPPATINHQPQSSPNHNQPPTTINHQPQSTTNHNQPPITINH